MAEVELRDGLFPNLDADNLGKRAYRALRCVFKASSWTCFDELLLAQVFDRDVARAADVVQNHELVVRLTLVVLEQARASKSCRACECLASAGGADRSQ